MVKLLLKVLNYLSMLIGLQKITMMYIKELHKAIILGATKNAILYACYF